LHQVCTGARHREEAGVRIRFVRPRRHRLRGQWPAAGASEVDVAHRFGDAPGLVVRAAVDFPDGDTMDANQTAPAWTQEQLLGLGRAFQETRILLTGAELDLFTLLAPAPRSAPDVATSIGADVRPLTVLLDALAAMGLLVKREDAYQTEPSASELLARDRPGSVLPMILHSVNLWCRWGELTRLVAGPRPDDQADESWLRSFIGAMHVIAAPQAAQIVSLVTPGRARRLLDVGGASGTYTLAFLAAAPELRATLFDRPPVVEMARERIAAAAMLDRVKLVGGDFYEDPLPVGHDLVFVSAIIHQNTPAENVELFRKAFAALEPGGRIVVRDHVLSEDRTQPKPGALFAINMLVAENGGNSYTFAEISSALTEAGFTRVRLIHPDTRMDGLVEAFKPGA
jgi:predicted O-methyltransferase YrrM